MDRAFTALTEAEPEHLYAVLADLATYPNWLAITDRVEPEPSGSPETLDVEGPAWSVTLRARIGPLSRSKRLRMVRTVADGTRVRFERQELDGRDHSPWVLEARVAGVDDEPYRSEAQLELSYGGSMWSGLLDGVLDSAATNATNKLQDYVATDSAPD